LQALAGTTRVTMRDKYEMPDLFGKMFDLILTRRAVRMRDGSWLERLKHLAERSA
jgi:hypothetical protein